MCRTHYDNFDKVFTFLHLFKSSMKSQKNVGWKASVQRFNMKRNINVFNTLSKLRNGQYKSKGFYTFTKIERGKLRLIRSNHISERIVQKCLCDYCLTPILKTKLIYDNGATLKHKGCLFVINRTKMFIRKAIQEHKPLYFLTMDFHSYFDEIDHDILIKGVSRYIKDEKILNLYTHFIKCFGDKGLGLGSQVSQISAVFYTHNIDNLIKHKCRHKFYTRYMDDSVIIDADKNKLKTTLEKIKKVCKMDHIILNEKKTMISKNKCSYLKRQFIANDKLYTKPKKDSYYRMLKKLKIFYRWFLEKRMTYENIEMSYQSWQSHFITDDAKVILKKAERVYNKYKEKILCDI